MRLILALLMLCTAPVQANELRAFAFAGVTHLTISEPKKPSRFLTWGAQFGTGVHLRWSIVRHSQGTLGGGDCGVLTPLSDALWPSEISERVAMHEFREAAAQWSGIADITFEYVDDINQANIVLGAIGYKSDYWAFTSIDVEARPQNETDMITKALICLNPTRIWRITGGDNIAYSLQDMFGHEIGHAVGGLHHPDKKTQPIGIMSKQFASNNVRANEFEIAAVRRTYSPPRRNTPSN